MSRRSTRRPRRSQLVVGLLLGVLGFAMVAQVSGTRSDDSYAGLRSADLVQVLNGLTVENRRAADEIARLQRTRRSLLDSSRRSRAAIDRAREESTRLGILAGTIPAVGPGIRISVTDVQHRLTLNHLLDGVEELRDAGAEVIEFNDSVRVVAQTWFDDAAAGGIVIDGQRVRSPYVIDVIGDPGTLSRALTFTGGFISDVSRDHGEVAVARRQRIEITSVVQPRRPEYAQTGAGQ